MFIILKKYHGNIERKNVYHFDFTVLNLLIRFLFLGEHFSMNNCLKKYICGFIQAVIIIIITYYFEVPTNLNLFVNIQICWIHSE